MKEKKNIDRLFQEKFRDFEAHPSDAVWDKIAFAKAEEKDRRVIPFWLRLGGIAAALALLIGLGTVLFNEDDPQNTLVDTPSETIDEPSIEGTTSLQNPNVQIADDGGQETRKDALSKKDIQNRLNSNDTNTVVSSNARNSVTSNDRNRLNNVIIGQEKKEDDRVDIKNDKNRFNTNNASNTTTAIGAYTPNEQQNKERSFVKNENTYTPEVSKNTETAVTDNQSTEKELQGKSLIDTAKKIEEQKEEAVAVTQEESRKAKWDVGAVAAPVYYGDFGGSGIDPQFNDNGKSGDINLSYGVQVSYVVNDKFKLRTGVSKVDLSYGTNDIAFTPDISATRLSGVDYGNNGNFLSITDQGDALSQSPIAQGDGFQGGAAVSSGSLQQSIGYIEVPVEAVYTVSDNRLGIDLIGGMSTLILNNNEIAIESQEGLRTPIGTSNSLNEVSLTTNVGVGVHYKLTDKVKLSAEPTFKYQLNAFEGAADDFKPYYVGLYTGVSYRF